MSFLDDYVSYAEEFTDAPPSTHYRIALSLMSAAINRKVFIVQGDDRIYPNLWMMIVAPSGWNRKSTSMRVGLRILKEVNKDYIMETDYSSREKYIECLMQKPRGICFISEFKSFMGMLSRDYMAGMQSVLTELFDNQDYIKPTKTQGDIKIENPFLNFVACTTVEWLVNSIKDDDIAGGFLPRYLIFCAPKRDKRLPFQPPSNLNKKNALIAQLSKIDRIKGELKFSQEAIKYYEHWYNKFEDSTEKMPQMIVPFYTRLADYAKKFSMIYCIDRCFESLDVIAASGGDYWITDEEVMKEDMQMACNMAEEYADGLADFLDTEISFSWKEKVKKKIEKIIRNKYPNSVSRDELLRYGRVLSRDLSTILETLEEEHKIKINEVQVDGQGRRKTYTQQAIFWLNQEMSQKA